MENKILTDLNTIKSLEGAITLCHGVFDLFHIGHLNYIKAAKKLGLPLIVTITGDKYVNKGPGRPRFSEFERAKMLASIEDIDYVYVNQETDAINLIKKIKPKYYCKGKDYIDASTDITGKIKLEKDAVEESGGSLKIIDTDQESSSELINNNFSSLNEKQQSYIKKLKQKNTINDITTTLDKVAGLKVCLIGEIILDRYVFCNPENLSSKSPTVSSKYLYEEVYLGGVLAVARNLHEIGVSVDVFTFTGDDIHKMDVGHQIKELPFHVNNFRTASPTPIKTRYIKPEKNQRLFELFHIDTQKTFSEDKTDMINTIETNISEYDIILVTDFGHGLFNNQMLEYLKQYTSKTYLNAQTNSENYGYNHITKYKELAYFSIDEREARLALSDRFSDIDVLVNSFSQIYPDSCFSITLGSRGAVHKKPGERQVYCPAYFDMGLDATGAGDLYFAFTSLLTALGTESLTVPFLGNLYAGLKTRIQGNSEVVSKISLIKTLNGLLK